MIPAFAHDPFARRRCLGTRGDALLHLRQRLNADQVDVQLFHAAGCKMHVGIIESWHDEMSAEIDNLRVLAFELLDLVIGANGNDAVAAHGDCLRALQEHSSHDGIAPSLLIRRIAPGKTSPLTKMRSAVFGA